MPLTFLSHQAPVVAAKIARPRWFDGTALVFGSMAPDFAYVLTDSVYEFDAHGLPGLLAFAVPVSIAAAWLVRTRVASVAFALLPSFGPLRLRDWRVLALRRPPWRVTLASAFLGAASHGVWDTFTHDRRWGASVFPVLRTQVLTVGSTPLSLARTFQYIGHVFGALITLALLRHIARRGLLAQWYGVAADGLTTTAPPAWHRALFFGVVAVCGALGFAWGRHGATSTFIIRTSVAMAVGVTLVSFVIGGHPAYLYPAATSGVRSSAP